MLVVLSLDEHLLDHLGIRQLDIVGATVDHLIDHEGVKFFVAFAQQSHRHVHESQELLLFHVFNVGTNQRGFEVEDALGFQLLQKLRIGLFFSFVHHFLDGISEDASVCIFLDELLKMTNFVKFLESRVHLFLNLRFFLVFLFSGIIVE